MRQRGLHLVAVLIGAAIALAGVSCINQGGGDAPVRQMKTASPESALIGKWEFPLRGYYSGTGIIEFFPDGTYIEHGDAPHRKGQYRLLADQRIWFSPDPASTEDTEIIYVYEIQKDSMIINLAPEEKYNAIMEPLVMKKSK